MPKTGKFRELYGKMSGRARTDVEKRVQLSLREMPLYELRAARRLTEQQLAQMSGLSQEAVHEMGENTDAYLKTLENFVEAMGGHLEINAVFNGGKIKLTSATDDSVRTSLGAKQSKPRARGGHPTGNRHAGAAMNRHRAKPAVEPAASGHGEGTR